MCVSNIPVEGSRVPLSLREPPPPEFQPTPALLMKFLSKPDAHREVSKLEKSMGNYC
jgi:hypothetical protein